MNAVVGLSFHHFACALCGDQEKEEATHSVMGHIEHVATICSNAIQLGLL